MEIAQNANKDLHLFKSQVLFLINLGFKDQNKPICKKAIIIPHCIKYNAEGKCDKCTSHIDPAIKGSLTAETAYQCQDAFYKQTKASYDSYVSFS